jgi:hypothetical protein
MGEKVKIWLKRLPIGTGIARILWIAAGVLLAGTVVNGARYAIRYGSIPTVTETTVEKSTLDDAATKKLLSAGQERIGGLQKKHPFAPPANKPNPPVCVGIFGPMAIIGDRGYLVNESVNGAKILRINSTEVVIDWEGKEMSLVPFAVENATQGGGQGGPRGDQQPQPQTQPQPGQATAVRVEGGGDRPAGGPPTDRFQFQPSAEMRKRMEEMRDRFENASPEERERMRQEFRQNRGEMGGMGGGPGGMGGMRGGRD